MSVAEIAPSRLEELLGPQTLPADALIAVGDATDRDGVSVIRFNRPSTRHAIDFQGWADLAATVLSLKDRRAVVITGSGQYFSAGADIKEFPERRLTPGRAQRYNERISGAFTAIQSCPAPIIAMVRGLAVGGGLELAAACDVRLAEVGARFGLPIGRLGVTLGLVEARTLARQVGAARLKELVYSGRLIDGREAQAIGLVQTAVESSDLVSATISLLDQIVAAAPAPLRSLKFVLDLADREIQPADVDALIRSTIEVYGGADLREGVASFVERRTPRFPSSASTGSSSPARNHVETRSWEC